MAGGLATIFNTTVLKGLSSGKVEELSSGKVEMEELSSISLTCFLQMGRERWKFRLPEEAFFASVLIYFGIAVITLPDRNKGRVGLVVFKRFQSIVGRKKNTCFWFLFCCCAGTP